MQNAIDDMWYRFTASTILSVCLYQAQSSGSIETSVYSNFTNNRNINEWSSPPAAACISEPCNFVQQARSGHVAAVYTRGPANDPNSDDMPRMIVFGGRACDDSLLADTWLYYPMVNSWIRPQFTDEPSPRFSHTMNTL